MKNELEVKCKSQINEKKVCKELSEKITFSSADGEPVDLLDIIEDYLCNLHIKL